MPQLHNPSPHHAALTDPLSWIPTIPQGCAHEVAHALHLKMFRQYGAHASSLPQSPSCSQWDWLRTHVPTLPRMADVLKDFMANPPQP